MKSVTLVLLVGMVVAIAAEERGVAPVPLQRVGPPPAVFDPSQSVALFVGIRTFGDDDTLQNVPYAVDDAVDLAYTFALDPRVALVRPRQVALALSDDRPRKESSRRRLAELKRHGAVVTPATQSQIIRLLKRQAGTVGAGGIFIVSFATHGFSEDGAQYLVASNSLFREITTAIPAARILDIVAKSNAGRSLILLDTCRERVRRQRSAIPEPFSAAPLIQRMGLTAGQVVLYGAAAGQWAYDDDIRQNGVFTGAVLDALQCRTGHDRSGMVTVSELSETVERAVLAWIRTNRDPDIRNATQASIDGAARAMPLAVCSRRPPPDPPAVAAGVAGSSLPRPSASRTPLRPLLAQCRADGETLMNLYGSREPEDFVTSYVRWRDGCVAVLRELDGRASAKSGLEPIETVRFLSVANVWCATKCPDVLSAGNCGLFREKPRAERCSWDLYNALKQIDDILVRNPSALQSRGPQ